MNNPEINPRITFGQYKLNRYENAFEIWHGTWTTGYHMVASGDITFSGLWRITYQHPYHRIPPRVIIELQKQL